MVDDDFPEIEEEYDEVDREMDELENAIQECGKDEMKGRFCSLGGTEYCSFRCPFNRVK